MQIKTAFALLAMASLSSPSGFAQEPEASHYDGKKWWEHVKVLADDKMEGRETGSQGLRDAEEYIVTRLKEYGVEPAGSAGYYQPVKLQSRKIIEKASSISLIRDGEPERLVLGDDAYFNTRADLDAKVEAALVFAGYGLTIPEKNYDDLAGVDINGKIAVVLSGSPADIPGALASHYQSVGERWKALHKAGAIGLITIPNPAYMDIPWARLSLNRTHITMVLADPEFDETKGEKLSLTFNPAKAEQLFQGSGHTFEEIAELGKTRAQLPRFPLNVSVKTNATVEREYLTSTNVVGRLQGQDPKLRDEYVVLSAHIDHLGIGEPVRGDSIYNGALDNAAGCAVLLDVASSLSREHTKLRRSVLFLFVTGEEKGQLGSQYFAAFPTVPMDSLVANVNIDMFLPLVPLRMLTVYGLQESSLGDNVSEVGKRLGIHMQPDPEPARNLFVRSDQYSFVRHGIPALAMKVGYEPGSPEHKIFKNWLTERYHAPSDDLNQPIDLSAAGTYEEVIRESIVSIANQVDKPRWKPESFFRRFAK